MKSITLKELRGLVKMIGIKRLPFDIHQLQIGYEVELEHNSANPLLNIVHNDATIVCKIALAHLYENPNYYTKLKSLNL